MAPNPRKTDEVLRQEKPAAPQARPERQQRQIDAEATFPDLPPLELPPLDLPPLPELDLDVLEQAVSQPPPPRRKIEYGSGNKDAGPVSFEQMLQLKPPSQVEGPEISLVEVPKFSSELASLAMPQAAPEPAPARPSEKANEPSLTALPGVQAVPDVRAEDIIRTQELGPTRAQPAREQRPAPTPIRKKPVPPSRPERPRATPLVFSQPPPPVPLRERVLEFEEEEATPIRPAARILVNLHQGYISSDGMEQPIDAGLQMALLKLKGFFGQEFDLGRLQQLRQQVRGMAAAEKPSGELLKAVITPVLKLGARRYTVINELLQVKEQLPLMEQSLVAALLEEVLSG